MREVVPKIRAMKAKFDAEQNEQSTQTTINTSALLSKDNKSHQKLTLMLKKLSPFFGAAEDSTFRVNLQKPINVSRLGLHGKYIGQVSVCGEPDGMGVFLSADNRSIYEGHFKS